MINPDSWNQLVDQTANVHARRPMHLGEIGIVIYGKFLTSQFDRQVTTYFDQLSDQISGLYEFVDLCILSYLDNSYPEEEYYLYNTIFRPTS